MFGEEAKVGIPYDFDDDLKEQLEIIFDGYDNVEVEECWNLNMIIITATDLSGEDLLDILKDHGNESGVILESSTI